MTGPRSTKPLFRAMRPRNNRTGQLAFGGDWPDQEKPATRDPLDYDPTPGDATRAFLAVEGARIREIGGPVWENAVGGGHIARELGQAGFDVVGSDVVDRGWPGTQVRSFFDFDQAPADIIVTNPPYGEISARDGHGRWLRHTRDLGVRYCAMLLNWEWIAGRINGMDALHTQFPVSRAYVCCWKVDFRGKGRPPQRNGWHVWDADWRGKTVLRRLFKDPEPEGQGVLV